MMRRGRKTLITLDSGAWWLGRLVGPGCRESGVRVQPAPNPAKGKATFVVADPDSGIGFAL